MSAASRHEGRAVHAARALCLALAIALSGQPVEGQPSPGMTPAAMHARVDPLFSEYAMPGAPGAAVVVAVGDSIIFAAGYGLADVEHGVPVTPATAFRLASVTKQFTAAAILTLVEAGRVSLEARLGDLLPNVPAYAHDVNVRQLLTHTSGLPDYEALLGNGAGPQLKDRDVLTLLQQGTSLYFPAGTSWRYSNSGYAMLALIVERVSGESFAQYLREHIFDRAGMPDAVAHVDGVDTVALRAYGHSGQRGAWRRTDQSRTSAVLGDGGIYASAEELARWSAALSHDVVMTAPSFHDATTPVTLPSGAGTSYGFGWFLDNFQGHARQRHEGDSIGFRTAIQRYPEQKLTVIVLVNRGAAPIDALSDGVARIFLEP